MTGTETAFGIEWAAERTDLAATFRRLAAAFEDETSVTVADGGSATIDPPVRATAEVAVETDAEADPAVARLAIGVEWDDDGSSVRIDDAASTTTRDDAADATTGDGRATTVVGPESGRSGASGRPAETGSAVVPPEGILARRDRDVDGRAGRRSRFEVYEDRAGEWRWRLVHWNGNVVADSGEGYASKSNARRAVRSAMRVAPSARVVDREGDT